MSILKRNMLANFCGSIWIGIMGFVFLPLYIHFLGVEAFGLIGIFSTLLGVLGLLDMGLSNTLNREMARLSVQKENAQEMRDLVRTLEIPYWIIGLVISISVIILAPIITHYWVHAENISFKSLQTSFLIMGVTIAFQWPISFYSGGLMGLQRQMQLNIINAAMSTFRGLGAVLVLLLVSPTIEVFFLWQLIINIVHISLIRFFLWFYLPVTAVVPRFRSELLQKIWHFAAGVTGITVLSTILTQLDKIILIRMLSLQNFGYYSLASTIAITLYRLVSPVYSATYPRLTNLVALGAIEEIKKLYHKSSQLVSVIVLSTALVVAVFSKEILLLWTQNHVTTEHTYLLVSVLVMGTAFQCLMNIPYALQLAFGWTRLPFLVNLISVIILSPFIILFTEWYGAIGAASIWLILTGGGYMLISLPIMYRRLLSTEKWRWYFFDVGLPFMAAGVVVVMGRLIIKIDWPPVLLIVSLGLISVGTLFASALVADQLNVLKNGKCFLSRTRLSLVNQLIKK